MTNPWDKDFTVRKLYLCTIRVAPPGRRRKVATLKMNMMKTCTLTPHPFIIQVPTGCWRIKKKQQEIDSRRWQMRNAPSPASFLQVRYAPMWVISLPHCGVCAGHKWPTGWKSEHIKRRVRRPPWCETKNKYINKITLLPPHDSLDYPRRSPLSDMTQYEKWWMPQLISSISSGLNIKRQTTTEKENPQIGSAVWRGIIENASLSFIPILCQPAQPDLKGFSIKSWTWQVMTIYSTHAKKKKSSIKAY